jgi:hypothetical protein
VFRRRTLSLLIGSWATSRRCAFDCENRRFRHPAGPDALPSPDGLGDPAGAGAAGPAAQGGGAAVGQRWGGVT